MELDQQMQEIRDLKDKMAVVQKEKLEKEEKIKQLEKHIR